MTNMLEHISRVTHFSNFFDVPSVEYKLSVKRFKVYQKDQKDLGQRKKMCTLLI